jgi:peptidyl-prolyl cis-trans isomerase D
MAVIQKIRDKYAKLTGGLIVLALIGFILMDYGKSGSSRSTTIGKIEGRNVDMSEYEAKIKEREDQLKQQNPNMELDDNTQAQVRDQVWSQMVSSELLKNLDEQLGITVSDAEMNDLLTGPNPDPQVRQAFTNPQTGVFNPQEVSATIQRVKNDPNMKDKWAAFEASIKERRYAEKFNALLSGGIYVPKFILDNQFEAHNSLASIQYVKVPYTSIPDAQVKVTDEDIKQYMQAHKAMFQIRQPSRSIEYVSFKVIPSADDSAKALTALSTIKSEFSTTTDAEGFVNRNSENPVAPNYYTKEQLKGLPNVEELVNAPVNSVVGPFFDGSSFVLAKILEKTTFPDSVKCRHILIKTAEGGNTVLSDSAAKSRIDSAIALIHSGVPFDSVAARYSEDAGSKDKGGVYEFSLPQKSTISKEFGDFIFGGKTGESKLVKVSNDNYSGYHYIEIMNQSASSAVSKLAFVSKELTPDKNTYNNIYSKATQFAAKAGKGNFDKVAEEMGVSTANADGLDANSFLVRGLGSARDLVKWAYDAKLENVSPIYTVGDNYIIAKLTNIQDKGLATLTDETRPVLKSYVLKEKKAQIILDKYKTAPSSLEQVASVEKQAVSVADSLKFPQSFIPGIGNEPKVIGYAFNPSFKEHSISPAIPGNEGVYFISVTGRSKAAAGERNLSNERRLLESGIQQAAGGAIMNAIRESADVEDKRGELY